MAYNRINYLSRVLEIQRITLEHKKKGCTQEWIYANCIASRFHISKSTYSNYPGINTTLEPNRLKAKQHAAETGTVQGVPEGICEPCKGAGYIEN